MQLVETIEVGAGGAASIEFTSIPQDGTDLLVKLSMRGTNSAVFDQILMRINGSTSTYTIRGLVGDGSSPSSDGTTGLTGMKIGVGVGANATANTFSNTEVYIPNYTGSTNKTILNTSSNDLNGSGGVIRRVGLWRNTSAITSITITTLNASTFSVGTTATLYGIL